MEKTISMEPSVQKVRRAVIQFASDYFRRSVNTRVPSLREICRDDRVVKACGGACYPKKLEPIFPPELDGSGPLMKRMCKASHVPAPTARIRKAMKATEAKAKKAKKADQKKTVKPDAELAVAEVQETARQPGSREDLQRSIEMEMDQRRYRKKMAEEKAKQIKLLALDPNKEISGPVLDALAEVFPRILKHCHGITLSFWTLKELNKITGGDLSYETVTRMVQYARLSDEEKQAIRDLLGKLGGTTLYEIAKYAKLSDEEKEAVRALLGYSLEMKMSPLEAIVFLNLKKKIEEKGARGILSKGL
ncbi:MAG TPA: hypothetical protein VMW36_01400 [Patescibacteria group bacterium]|nr:hypothetical protein [Patescibacteria group bacterium]